MIVMKWESKRIDGGTLLVVESDMGNFAMLIRDSELKGHHDPQWLFWSAVLDLKFCAMGESKSQGDIYKLLEDLKCQ